MFYIYFISMAKCTNVLSDILKFYRREISIAFKISVYKIKKKLFQTNLISIGIIIIFTHITFVHNVP